MLKLRSDIVHQDAFILCNKVQIGSTNFVLPYFANVQTFLLSAKKLIFIVVVVSKEVDAS